MLKQLRIKMTLLYLAGAILLAVTVGAVAYSLVSYYFGVNTDHALKVKIGLQFAAYDIPLPPSLYQDVRQAGLVITLPVEESGDETENQSHEKNEGLQEAELADIYILPLTSNGELISGVTSTSSVALIDKDSALAAFTKGSDLRTITDPNGQKLRVLSYKVPGDYAVQVFQAGRYLTGQNIVLSQLLKAMLWIGIGSILLISLAAWLLAGRTIRPIQQTWDKQQEFVANASHELRAPLTLIRAGVEMALRNTESPGQKQYLQDALRDSDRMNKLIEELLLLSRLDAGAQSIELKEIEIVPFLEPILRQLHLSASQNEIKLVEKISEVKIVADPQRVEQLILILFDNALQHTPTGGEITLVTYKEGNMGCILLEDTGAGIPEKQLERVFDRFYRVKQGTSKGSGLGLSIAKSLVENQNGSIVIRNRAPKGLDVLVKFPLSHKPD
jgi:signal transduction histidine kinase